VAVRRGDQRIRLGADGNGRHGAEMVETENLHGAVDGVRDIGARDAQRQRDGARLMPDRALVQLREQAAGAVHREEGDGVGVGIHRHDACAVGTDGERGGFVVLPRRRRFSRVRRCRGGLRRVGRRRRVERRDEDFLPHTAQAAWSRAAERALRGRPAFRCELQIAEEWEATDTAQRITARSRDRRLRNADHALAEDWTQEARRRHYRIATNVDGCGVAGGDGGGGDDPEEYRQTTHVSAPWFKASASRMTLDAVTIRSRNIMLAMKGLRNLLSLAGETMACMLCGPR